MKRAYFPNCLEFNNNFSINKYICPKITHRFTFIINRNSYLLLSKYSSVATFYHYRILVYRFQISGTEIYPHFKGGFFNHL